MVEVSIKKGANFEFIMSQLVDNYNEIICVCNGNELLIYDTVDSIPLSINRDFKKVNTDVGTVEYHWRSPTGASLVFFSEKVDKELKKRKMNESVLATITLPAKPRNAVALQTYFKM